MTRERAKERECENAIKKTLAYKAVFKYPLSYYQLVNSLIAKKEFNYLFLNKQLRRLLKNKHIRVEKNRFYLGTIKPVSWHTRFKTSEELFYRYGTLLKVLNAAPWIKLVAVTGSLAAYNADKDSDIDIFIITAKNRVWLSRFFTVMLLKIINLYPKIEGEAGKVCANLYIDEENLSWPKDKRSLFVAHDIITMQPVVNRDGVYFRFMSANRWINDYFPGFKFETGDREKPAVSGSSVLIDLAENFFMKLQLYHMKKKKTTETTKKHIIHFNKNDNSRRILSEYTAVLQKIS